MKRKLKKADQIGDTLVNSIVKDIRKGTPPRPDPVYVTRDTPLIKKEKVSRKIKAYPFMVGAISLFLIGICSLPFVINTKEMKQDFTEMQDYSSDKVKNRVVPIRKFSINDQKTKVKKAFTYFKKRMTKQEMMTLWIDLFSNVKYKVNGTLKFNTADCLSAFYEFLWAVGAKCNMRDIPKLRYIFTSQVRAGEAFKRRSHRQARHGDVIIFRPIKGRWHIGIVFESEGRTISYMDMNVRSNMGFRETNFYNKRIYAIYSIEYPFFAEEVLDKE